MSAIRSLTQSFVFRLSIVLGLSVSEIALANTFDQCTMDDNRECLTAAHQECLKKHPSATLPSSGACYAEETEAWRVLAASALERLRRELPPRSRAALEDQQRAWESYRGVACDFPYKWVSGFAPSVGAEKCRSDLWQTRFRNLRAALLWSPEGYLETDTPDWTPK